MKKLLLFTCSLFAAYGFSQTTIYQETFETGNTFTMNTSDLGAANTYNTWLMNNTYSGGAGTLICLGFPLSFTVVNTPTQPVGITGSPSSNYMHITAQAAVTSGINCASYIPSDGTCALDESNFSKMTTSFSTAGFTGVDFSFWWMCAGSATAVGEVYYSLDNGVTWVLALGTLNNVTNWTQTTLTDPAWDNQSSLMFGFRFINTVASTAADPAFSVDEILVTGMGAMNSITTTDFQQQLSWCLGDSTSVPVQFDAVGSYNPGNVFTSELSDAAGSFAAPTTIGNLTSSASGIQTVFGYAYGAIPAGTGYRIRVIASDPATIGTDNGTDIIIYPLPSVSSSTYADLCVNGMPISLNGGMPSGGNYTGVGVSGGNFDPSAAGVGTASVDYSIIDVNGCMSTVTETIVVHAAPVVTFATIPDHCVSYSPYTLMAQPAGGVFTGPGVSGDIFTPATAGVGTWTITYDYTDGNGCSGQALQTVNVDGCVGLFENNKIEYAIYPNPAQGNFTIVSEMEFDAIELRDINGRLIQSINSNELVNISKLSSGVYFIEMNHEGQLYIERLIIK